MRGEVRGSSLGYLESAQARLIVVTELEVQNLGIVRHVVFQHPESVREYVYSCNIRAERKVLELPYRRPQDGGKVASERQASGAHGPARFGENEHRTAHIS